MRKEEMNKTKIDTMWKFVINAYLLFWTLILGLGGFASMVLHAPESVMKGIMILCSWSPTIVLLLMMKKLKPHTTIKEFYVRAFKAKIQIWIIAIIPIIIIGIFLMSVWISSALGHTAFSAQLMIIPSTLFTTILFTISLGPSGEESAWRGYLRQELEGRYGFLKGNLILGLVWAFWHTPLWFVSSEYGGTEAMIYISANIIILTSLTLIMGIFMRKCNNLFIAFWIHFLFNLSLSFFVGDVYFFIVFSIIYLLAASTMLAIRVKGQKTES